MDYAVYPIDALSAGDYRLLSKEERAVQESRGDVYLRIRTLLRRELGRRLGCSPEAVSLSVGKHGKPLCAAQPFNLSHAGGLLALAFHDREIGIDIERRRPLRHLDTLAKRIMSEEQWAAFCARSCPPNEFFDCWCAAEALVKWAGVSIFEAHRFPFRWQQGRIITDAETGPLVELFHPRPDFSGAVAYCP